MFWEVHSIDLVYLKVNLTIGIAINDFQPLFFYAGLLA